MGLDLLQITSHLLFRPCKVCLASTMYVFVFSTSPIAERSHSRDCFRIQYKKVPNGIRSCSEKLEKLSLFSRDLSKPKLTR